MASVLADPKLEALIADLQAKSHAQEPQAPVYYQARADAGRTDWNMDAQDHAFYADKLVALEEPKAEFCYSLCRAIGGRRVVEFGTSFGISTLHLAAALRDNGGGRLIGSEFEPSKIKRARENLAAGGLSDLVEIREGDAMQTLARDLPDTIDFVLLDGAKSLYPPILSLLEPRLRDSALIVADNADDSPEYLARVRSADSGYLSVAFGGDVELSMRLKGTAW